MKKKFLLFVMLICITAFSVTAQSSWIPLSSGIESALLSVDFINVNTGIAVGEEGVILKTVDGGENWQLINAGITTTLNAVSYIDENDIIIAGNSGTILKSTDGGQTWAQKNVPGITYDLLGVDLLSSGKGVACGRAQTILQTTDNGENWTVLRTNYFGAFYSAQILNDNLAFVYGVNSIFTHLIGKIINGDSLAFRDFYIFHDDAMTEGMIYDAYQINADSCVTVGSIFPGVAAITSNQSWTEQLWNSCYILHDYYLLGVDFVGSYGVAVGSYGVAVGADYSESASLIVESNDMGQTWTEIPENFKKASANRNVKLIGNTGYIVGNGGKILKKAPAVGIDVRVADILSPQSGENLGMEDVTILVKNEGTESQTDVPVYYTVNSGNQVGEIVPGTIGQGETVEYTFLAKADLSQPNTTYIIEACTALINDENPQNDCLTIEVTNTVSDRPWNFTVTGLAHTISVPNTANPNIYGEPVEPGDWVGVFFTDNGGNEVCGGAAMFDARGNALVMAYGDDPTTETKDGFANGEIFRWKLFDTSSQGSYPAGATYDQNMPDQDGFANLGLSKLTGLTTQWCLYYTLAEGWNSLSSYVVPSYPAVENMFTPVVDNLTILQNLTSVYWPAENINTIGNFDNGSGYAIKMTEVTELSICGPSYTGKTLSLSAGWHYLPVLSQFAVSAMDLFASHLDDIVIVQDLIGDQVIWPEMGIYTLETLEPGKAYKIKLNNGIDITFPDWKNQPGNQKIVRYNTLTTHWGTFSMTPSTQVTALLTEAMGEIQMGDEIGAFGQDGTLFGYMTVAQTSQNQVVVLFGDDTLTGSPDGYSEGEPVTFKLYRPMTGKEYNLIAEYRPDLSNPTGQYYSSSFGAIRHATLIMVGTEELQYGKIRIYPNPASEVVRVSVPENTGMVVTIYDALGNQVLDGAFSNPASLDVSSLASGIYLIKVKTDNLVENRKLIIR
ncbi:MAG: YCF48-related protein [Bacteroidales bacterium]|nr:YCF48-related protein [Bacteroidales bacterium]